MKLGLTLALALVAAPCLAETNAGYVRLQDTTAQGRPLALSIWYPTDAPTSDTIGGNPVFQGAAAAPGAPLPQETLPLVVLSHGGLRSAGESGAWLGSAIAQAGHVVVEVNGPRPTGAAEALDEIWQRPQDISRAIDRMLTDEDWGSVIAPENVSVVGFALGATAALSLAGAQLDAARYMGACDGDTPLDGPDCRWFAAQGVEMSATSQSGLADLARDPRITAIVSIAPEYRSALGAADNEVRQLDISLGTTKATSGTPSMAETRVIPEASIYDAFALCTKAGPDILMEEDGDASLCGDSTQARREVHQMISEAITTFLAP